MKIKILDTIFDIRNNLVILHVFKYETEAELNIAIKANELPQALGLGKPGIIYPPKVIGQICSSVKDKELDWQSTLDKESHISKDDMAKYKECLKNNSLLDEETDESIKLREKIEAKINNLSAFPFEQAQKYVQKTKN